ncbi:MAG TPA: hypothetical protein VLE97_08835 [Gaiellaceae bacterium]|nr:hypothetical protein [Gaiellaceae bacterium]
MTRHVTEQQWVPEMREDGVYLVAADDRTAVVKLCRPDQGSDLMIAGYITGLQAAQLHRHGNTPRLRTCPGCRRDFAMLHICERCGQCDALDLPRDADRTSPCCSGGRSCVETNWRRADRAERTP